MERATVELILYVCPLGALAEQIDAYMVRSAQRFGRNAAHAFPPHITLTGFFHDTAESVPFHARCCSESIDRLGVASRPRIDVAGALFLADFHGLLIESSWAQQVAAQFAASAAASPTRTDDVRPKHELHLSLAYEFAAADREGLRALASELVDPAAAVAWEVRLYERRRGSRWKQHAAWAITDELEEHDR